MFLPECRERRSAAAFLGGGAAPSLVCEGQEEKGAPPLSAVALESYLKW